MKLTEEEEAICQKYSKKDEKGRVHCGECPLVKESNVTDVMCKAIGHYDAKARTWVPDMWTEEDLNEYVYLGN